MADTSPYGEFPIRAIIACSYGTKAWTGFAGILENEILLALDRRSARHLNSYSESMNQACTAIIFAGKRRRLRLVDS